MNDAAPATQTVRTGIDAAAGPDGAATATRVDAGPVPRARPLKHAWLRQRLRAEVERLGAHTALPTERELAGEYGVSRSTVRQALDALAEAGMVYRVHGAGTFVAATAVPKSLTMTSFTEDMRARGLVPGNRVLAADEREAGTQVAEQLWLGAADPVFRLLRLRFADGRPMCLETVHLPAARVPGLLERDLGGSLHGILRAEYGMRLVRAEQVWSAVSLDEHSAMLLGVPTGSPAFQVRRVGTDERARPQELTLGLYRADRYDVRVAVRRSQP